MLANMKFIRVAPGDYINVAFVFRVRITKDKDQSIEIELANGKKLKPETEFSGLILDAIDAALVK
jgi:hypothetical protein